MVQKPRFLLNTEPCPMRCEPERGTYFQREMSLKEWIYLLFWFDHLPDGDQHERNKAAHDCAITGISGRYC